MSSNASNAVGTVFQRWTGSTWVTLAEVKSIGGPNKTADTIEVTSLNSTAGYKEFIKGFKDGGSVPLSMNFTRANYDILDADFESDTRQNYQIVFSDSVNTSIEFEGLVVELSISAQVGDALTAESAVKVTDQPVVGSGGSAAPA